MPNYTRYVKIPGKSARELYDVVSTEIEGFLAKSSIMGGYKVQRDEKDLNVAVKGAMFNAELSCRNEEMELKVNLSLIAAPLKSKLDDGINKWLAKKFDLKILA